MIAKLRSEDMVGMCEAQRLWGREQKSQHPRGLRGSGELEISRKRCIAGIHSVEGVGAAGGVGSSIKSPIAQVLGSPVKEPLKDFKKRSDLIR